MHRVVVVGCGAMSRVWFEAAASRADVTIVGVVDLDLARAEAAIAAHGLTEARPFADVRDALAETAPDVVFDIAVPSARADIVAAALWAGCDVLSEKPMAETLEEARGLLALAAETGRRHVVIQNRRYIEPVRRIRAFLDSGAIGAVTSLHADFFIAPHFGGFREAMAHVLLLDMAVHTFDAARFLAGEDAVSVYAEEWEPSSSWYRQGSSAAAIFRLRSGVPFTYRGSWCADGLRTSWEASWRIVGTRGTLLWDGGEDMRAETGDPARREGILDAPVPLDIPPLATTQGIGGHEGVMADFFESLRTGRPAETDGTANIATLAMVLGAIESAETGRRIDIRL